MRVLVTGHRGYIGSVLTCMLRNARCDVVGLDCDHYRQCDFGRIAEDVPSYDTDVRNVELGDLLSFDAVIHLAGLPDGLSSQFDRSTLEETNLHATVRLATLAKQAKVSRFIFASTCDVYGKTGATIATEACDTRPTSRTAELKLLAEREILSLTDHDFSPVVLRQGDVYGVSPRLRLDLVVNDLVASAITHGRIAMNYGAAGWRSLIHVEDLGRIYAAILTAPDSVVNGEVFNAVSHDQHLRVIDVADAIVDLIPMCSRSPATELHNEMSRRIDSTKLLEAIPTLRSHWTLPLGIRQLQNACLGAGLTPGDWRSNRFRRALHLQSLVETRQINNEAVRVSQRDCVA